MAEAGGAAAAAAAAAARAQAWLDRIDALDANVGRQRQGRVNAANAAQRQVMAMAHGAQARFQQGDAGGAPRVPRAVHGFGLPPRRR